jgi:hypothetical protein
MSSERYVPGAVLVGLVLYAASLRALVFIMEALLLPSWLVRAVTVLVMLGGLGFLIFYYLRHSVPVLQRLGARFARGGD